MEKKMIWRKKVDDSGVYIVGNSSTLVVDGICFELTKEFKEYIKKYEINKINNNIYS